MTTNHTLRCDMGSPQRYSVVAGGQIVYSSVSFDIAREACDQLNLDQDPAYQAWLAQQDAYAFEDCYA